MEIKDLNHYHQFKEEFQTITEKSSKENFLTVLNRLKTKELRAEIIKAAANAGNQEIMTFLIKEKVDMREIKIKNNQNVFAHFLLVLLEKNNQSIFNFIANLNENKINFNRYKSKGEIVGSFCFNCEYEYGIKKETVLKEIIPFLIKQGFRLGNFREDHEKNELLSAIYNVNKKNNGILDFLEREQNSQEEKQILSTDIEKKKLTHVRKSSNLI